MIASELVQSLRRPIQHAVDEYSVNCSPLYYTRYSISKGETVAHTAAEKKALLARVNRVQGQLQSIREAIEDEKECADVLQQIAACRGAVNSLLVEIVEGEIRFHVLGRNAKVDSREARAAENLVELLRRYIK